MTVTNLTSTFSNFDTTDTTTITSIGGGQGAAVDPDIYLQGDQSVSRRIDNLDRGFYVSSDNGVARNMSATNTHLKVWVGSVTWGLVTDLKVVIDDGTNQDRHTIPTDTFPTTRSGFIPVWVDVNRTPEVNGSANIASVSGVGLNAIVGDITSNLKNIQLDAATYGTAGYALTSTTNLAELATAEENASTGLKGVLSVVEGIYFCFSRLIIGASDAAASTPVATTYSDTNETIVFPDQQLVSTTYMGQTISLGNASTTYTLTGCVIQSSNPSGATRRPDIIFTGTSGTASLTNCSLLGMRTVDFTSTCTFDGGILDTVNLTQGGSEIKNCEIRTRTATQVAVVDDATFGTTSGIHDVTFAQNDSGHAIEITAAGSYTFTNIDFSGYGGTAGSNLTENSGANDAAILNSSGGSVTISVVGGTTPSVRNVNTGSTTTVENNINITLTNMKDNTEVRVYLTSTLDNTPPYTAPTEIAGIENAIAGSADARTFTFSVASGTGITIRTFNQNWIADDISLTPTSTQDVQIAQRTDRVYST